MQVDILLLQLQVQQQLSLRDVEGQFQINEPLIVNGLDAGRNITAIDDVDFSQVKSVGRTVGVSTFAANFALTENKSVFPEGATFFFDQSAEQVKFTCSF